MTFNVGSPGELDRIESFLRSRDLFTDRRQIADGASDLLRARSRQLAPRVRLLCKRHDRIRVLRIGYQPVLFDGRLTKPSKRAVLMAPTPLQNGS